MKNIKIILAVLIISAIIPAVAVAGSLTNTVNVSATIEPVLEASLVPGSSTLSLAVSVNSAANIGARYQLSEKTANPRSAGDKAVTYTFYSL